MGSGSEGEVGVQSQGSCGGMKMRILVAGGKLQGVEAAYLAKKAGMDVVLVDKAATSPAAGLCSSFRQLDLLRDRMALLELCQDVDLIISAVEDQEVLMALAEASLQVGVPMAWDESAYEISASKKKSDALFARHGVPAPLYWPDCGLPLIAKLDGSSGSRGVRRITTERELKSFLQEIGSSGEDYIMQEFIGGKSYSLEVIGFQGIYIPLQVTALEMDEDFDCKRVVAPADLPPSLVNQFRETAIKIAGLVNLTGIMDVEVIEQRGVLKVLEIDARLPSQTPTAVYHSTGVNMLELLANLYTRGELLAPELTPRKAVIYEHILVTPGKIEFLGEHIMAGAGPLALVSDFFGASEALTNFTPGRKSWVATLIITAASRNEVWEKRCAVLSRIKKETHQPALYQGGGEAE